MTKQILVAYATGSGSTAEVAAAIGDVLRGEGVIVDVHAVSDVKDISVYSAVVLGSSIRVGRWLPGAVKFLETFQQQMGHIPVAYFTTCLTMVNDTADSRRTVLEYMKPVRRLAPHIEPVGLGLFAGSLNPELQHILPGESGPYGDFRNWKAIRGWAEKIRPLLHTGRPHQAAPIVLRDTVLSFTDMTGLDLAHMNMSQAEMEETTLRKANLQGANLRESSLKNADLRQTDLRQADLCWADMSQSDLRNANLAQANLMGAILQGADLSSADLTNAILNGVMFTGAKLVKAILTSADLNWANLAHADLTDTDLSNAKLCWADLSEANLTNATLKDATYNSHTLWPAQFSPESAGCIVLDMPQ